MIRRLRNKFIAIAMLSLFLVLAVMIAAINILNYRTMVMEADETLMMLAFNHGRFPMGQRKNAGQNLFSDELPDEPDASERSGMQFGPRAMRERSLELPYMTRFFTVTLNEDGEIASVDLENIASVDRPQAEELAASVLSRRAERGFLENFRYGYAESSDGQTMLLFLSRERELDSFRSFLLISLTISLIGYLAVILLITLLSGKAVRPIAESYEKQKRFITDAGHELKTPITIINADVDVLETEHEDSEWLSDIRLQTDRLTTLTNDLIYLSKMEETGVRSQMIDFPLSDVAGEIVQSFSAVAIASGKDLQVDLTPGLSISGDEKALRKLISILLDNALKYSPENGVIRFALSESGKQITLRVTNTASGLKKGNYDRLFDRFYRLDSSRNSESGGFGLGLSIAKAVVAAHKGKIGAYSEDGASLTVEATLPAS